MTVQEGMPIKEVKVPSALMPSFQQMQQVQFQKDFDHTVQSERQYQLDGSMDSIRHLPNGQAFANQEEQNQDAAIGPSNHGADQVKKLETSEHSFQIYNAPEKTIDAPAVKCGTLNDVQKDLFESTFGTKEMNNVSDDNEDNDSDDSHRESGKPKLSQKAKGKQQVTDASMKHKYGSEAHDMHGTSSTLDSSDKNTKCEKSSSDASTNKMTKNHGVLSNKPSGMSQEKEADLGKKRSRLLVAHEKFHKHAIQFIPRLPLPAHRYWIGVLNIDRKPKNAKDEKHFTWMKGNRMTTIQTIWNTYQTMVMRDDFVLILGAGESVEFKDRCEELDYFNDKKIILRAVEMSDAAANGVELGKGCPPVVVEIDIDDD